MKKKSLLLLRQLFPVTTKTCYGSTMGSPARNDECLTWLDFHLEMFFFHCLFFLSVQAFHWRKAHKPSGGWHKPLPSDRHAAEILRIMSPGTVTHTYTHTHRLQKIALHPSVIWFSDALLHDLPQVWVLHGGSHSFFIINLFVNWRHKLY